MKQATGEFKVLPISAITVAASGQPRTTFDVGEMASLVKSIKTYGLRQPLVVQKSTGGEYIIVEGERRYRALSTLKYKEVPCIVEELTSDNERTIIQFNIQGQHKDWTPIDKARAVKRLCEEYESTPTEMASMLGMSPDTMRQYYAFSQLADTKKFENDNIGIQYAPSILALSRLAEKLTEQVLEKEFTDEDKENLQSRVIDDIKTGKVVNRHGITKLNDIFKADPDAIEKYITGEKEVSDLYKASDARVITAIRKAYSNATYLEQALVTAVTANGIALLKEDSKVTSVLKRVAARIESLGL